MAHPDFPSKEYLRQRRFDFCPWFFKTEATPAEREEQCHYQTLLGQEYGVAVGKNCYLSPHAAIVGTPGQCLLMGNECYVAANAYVTDRAVFGADCTVNPYATIRGAFRCGDGVRIGSYACIVGFNHGFAQLDVPIHRQPHTSLGILLGDDVWIGSHVTIVDGVRVGSHTILAGGAIVTKDVPDFAVVGGNPARILRMRNTPPAP